MVLLCAISGAGSLYLVVIHPFHDKMLQLCEMVASLCETGTFVAACFLLDKSYDADKIGLAMLVMQALSLLFLFLRHWWHLCLFLKDLGPKVWTFITTPPGEEAKQVRGASLCLHNVLILVLALTRVLVIILVTFIVSPILILNLTLIPIIPHGRKGRPPLSLEAPL